MIVNCFTALEVCSNKALDTKGLFCVHFTLGQCCILLKRLSVTCLPGGALFPLVNVSME